MSEMLAQLARFDNEPVLLTPSFTSVPASLIAAQDERSEGFDYGLSAAAVFGFSSYSDSKPFVYSDGIAYIPIQGILLNRYNYAGSWATGYQAIRSMLNAALADPDVTGIVFDANSPGGMVQGCFELADDIYAARQEKPILAVVDANACSACYALASSASKVVAIRSAAIGSVGVVMMHVDYSGALDQSGVKVTYVYAGDHKVDGNPYEPLSKSVKAEFQAEIDAIYEEFTALVARNRSMSVDDVKATKAQVYRAEDAVSLGLIDAIAQPIDAISEFIRELSGSDNTGVDAMATQQGNQPAAAEQQAASADQLAAAATQAKAAERERINAIMSCDEAKDRSALANHLALTTELSVDEAKAILGAAAVETAPEATGQDARSGAQDFAAAMNGNNPNIGADAQGNGDDDDEEDVAARMLKNYSAASGRKLTQTH